MISSPVFESRFPVGSSARMMEGRLTSARANGNALALATRQFVRLVVYAVAQADIAQGLRGTLLPRLRINAGVNQRQFYIAQAGRAGEQIESLKNETDLAIADGGQFIVIHLRDILRR